MLRWNSTTKLCYERKMHCEGCELFEFCSKAHKPNPYHTRPIKYEVLKTYAERGKPDV